MRTGLVTTFHDTVNYCFNTVLETMGTSVRDVVYDRLNKKGIPVSDISTRFDESVEILNDSFGGAARIIVYKTLVELYQQYSMHVDFTYQDSLKDRMVLLKERVVGDHLVPRRAQRDDSVMSYEAALVQSPRPNSRGAAVWLILRETALMLMCGVAIALPIVWSLGRLIESQLFGVHATDWQTSLGSALLVACVAVTASALPVRRATGISPVEALRCE